jgi:predicted kinase
MKLFELTQKPTVYFPIGPSGTGKSTVYKKLKEKNPNLNVFSLDILRHKFYDKNDYAKAWKMSTEDKDFSKKANDEFFKILKQKQDLYIDNTNLTPKSRKFYITNSRKPDVL